MDLNLQSIMKLVIILQAFFKALADLERFRVSAYPHPSALPFILKCETDSWTQENLNN